MALANKCDICGKYYDQEKNKEVINHIRFCNKIMGPCSERGIKIHKCFDVCSDCSGAFLLLLDKLSGKDDQNEEEKTPEESEDERATEL